MVAAAESSITRRAKALSSTGVVAAGLVAVFVNVATARHYRRWDVTRAQLYTLSEPTLHTLRSIEAEARDVEVFVFVGGGDPLLGSLKAILQSYQAQAPRRLVVRYLDPDRDRAEFLRVSTELDVRVGKVEGGRVLADAQVVVRHGKRPWYVKTDDMVVLEPGDDAKVRPRVEAALTGAIRAVLATDRPRVCFTRGHHEASIDDPDKTGLSTLKNTLAKDNYAPESVDLTTPKASLVGCGLIAIVAPSDPFRPEEARLVVEAVERGAPLLLVAPPQFDPESKGLRPHGLADVAALGGVALDDAVIVEEDAGLREPNGLGLIFRARVHAHQTTDELRKFAESRGGEAAILVEFARPLRRMGERAGTQEVLVSSGKSFGLHDVASFIVSKSEPKRGPSDPLGPLDVATALQRGKDRGGARVVVVGTANLFLNSAYLDPSPVTVFGRTLGLLWVSWLATRPPVLDLPPKPAVEVAMHLSEDDIGAIGRYVLVYMPLAAALIGVAVWLRRRTTEGKRRRVAQRA